jgi:hypothetical protein
VKTDSTSAVVALFAKFTVFDTAFSVPLKRRLDANMALWRDLVRGLKQRAPARWHLANVVNCSLCGKGCYEML